MGDVTHVFIPLPTSGWLVAEGGEVAAGVGGDGFDGERGRGVVGVVVTVNVGDDLVVIVDDFNSS